MVSPPMPEGFTAGSYQVGPRAPSQDGVSDLGARPDEVLAVIEDDEQALRQEGIDQCLEGRSRRLVGDTQCVGNGFGHGIFVRHGGQLDRPHTVARPVQKLGCQLES